MKKFLALILAVSVILSSGICLMAGAAVPDCDCDHCPSIVIPGVFQSEVKYYDDNGNEMLNADGEPYPAPFFLDDTGTIVKAALSEALLPIAGMLISQNAKDTKAANAVADVLGSVLGSKIGSDNMGNVIGNVKATKYDTALSNLSKHDQDYALDQIPLNDYVDICGMDHLYFFSYMSFDNIQRLVEELYQLIQTAKRETGHDKVNLVPISQGGSLENALMQYYIDNGYDFAADINRVCYIVPAADGASVLGEIFHYGLLDDPEALYGTMFPSLLEEDQEWLAYLINLILRIMPNADVNRIIDTAVDILVEKYLGYSTAMWALIPSGDYPESAEKYLSDPEDAYIREQTDWYYNAQLNHRKYILDFKAQGVEFFDICDYNYSLYQICDSWDDVNGDGIIQLDSTSLGATSAPVGCVLPEDYVQQNTYCSDPTHNHMDEERIVDASTGILPETTFYFKGQDHEKTARNDVIIRLATRILTDNDFVDIYSDPGYPQFNYARDGKWFRNTLKQWADFDTSALSPELAAEFNEAYAAALAAAESTYLPTDEYEAAKERFENVTYKIANGKDKPVEKVSFFIKLITKVFKFFSDFMLKYFGGKGISDIVFFRKVN